MHPCPKTCSNKDINDTMFRWFQLARERNITISGPMLQEMQELLRILKFTTEEPCFIMSLCNLEADTANLGELMNQIHSDIIADEYGSADDDLNTCFTFTNPSQWREERREEVFCTANDSSVQVLEDDSDDESSNEIEFSPPDSSIKSYSDAISDLLHLSLKKDMKKSVKISLCQLNVFRPCRMRVCTLLTRV